MKGLLPELVLNRTTKADFMTVFRRQLAGMQDELLKDIVPRRVNWVQPERAKEICNNYQQIKYADWSEWWLWSLIGCDALANGK